MANQSTSGDGFRPVKHKDGREYAGGGIPFYIPSTDATNYFIGDVVTIQTQSGHSSNQSQITASGSPGGVGGAVLFEAGTLMTVGAPTAGAGNAITGVIVHVAYDPVDFARPPYGKASTARVVWVETSRDVIYESRILNLTTAPGLDCVGNTVNLYSSTAGSTTTGTSGMGLDGSGLATSAGTTNQFRILGASRDYLNGDLTSANPKVYVEINNSTEINAATAI